MRTRLDSLSKAFEGVTAVLLLLAGAPLHAQPVFDSSSASATVSAKTVSWRHAVGSGTNRLLVVWVMTNPASASSTLQVTSVKYGNQAMTKVGGGSSGVPSALPDASGVWHADWYSLVAPATGDHVVSINTNAATVLHGAAMSFSHVNQSAPVANLTLRAFPATSNIGLGGVFVLVPVTAKSIPVFGANCGLSNIQPNPNYGGPSSAMPVHMKWDSGVPGLFSGGYADHNSCDGGEAEAEWIVTGNASNGSFGTCPVGIASGLSVMPEPFASVHTITVRFQTSDGSAWPSGLPLEALVSGGCVVDGSGQTGQVQLFQVTGGGNYTVNVAANGYTFSPSSGTINNVGADQTLTFVGTPPPPPPPSSSPPSATPQVKTPSNLWAHHPNPHLKGLVGALVVALPPGTGNTRIRVRSSGQTVDVVSGLGNQTRTLNPGRYDVLIGDAVIHGVEMATGQDTTLAVGAVRVSADARTTYEVVDESNLVVAKHFGSSVTALPAGTYGLRIGGAVKTFTIQSGQVVAF